MPRFVPPFALVMLALASSGCLGVDRAVETPTARPTSAVVVAAGFQATDTPPPTAAPTDARRAAPAPGDDPLSGVLEALDLGSSAVAGDGGDIGQPPEAEMFDPDTASGSGVLYNRRIEIRHMREGCASPGAGGGRGVFLVTVALLEGSRESICADHGMSVVVNGVGVVFGTPRADEITDDEIPPGLPALVFAFGGDDRVVLTGEAGGTVYAGAGNDRVFGGPGGDVLVGGDGDDVLAGNDGDDVLIGGAGNDDLSAGAGADELYGGDGDDVLAACPYDLDHDWLLGGPGRDALAAASLGEYALDAVLDYREGEDSLEMCRVGVPRP